MSEVMCELCGIRSAIKDDLLCEECSNRYSTLLRSARDRTREVNLLSSKYGEAILPAAFNVSSNRTVEPLSIDKDSTINRTIASVSRQESLTQLLRQPQTQHNKRPEPDESRLLETLQELKNKNENLRRQLQRSKRLPSVMICYALILIGLSSLALSIVLSSSVFAFTGLGLTFWGALLLFMRPQKFVRSELMDSTALSSLEAVDHFIDNLGYAEKGVYIPGSGNPGNAVAFIPSEPLQQQIPSHEQLERQPFAKNGVALVPPGLGLADLFEHELGDKFSKLTLEELRERLRKLLIEDLEIMDDFDMQIDGNTVRMKLVGSIYTDFCNKLKHTKKICSMLGCPMCSALACVLAKTTGKPVVFEGDKEISGRRILESTYRILEA